MKLNTFLNKAAWTLALILLVLAPFHAIFSTVLLYKFELADSSLAIFIKGWKEGIVALLILLAGLKVVLGKAKLTRLHGLIFTFISIAAAVSFFNHISLSQFIWGARSEFTFWLLLSALTVFVGDWSKKQIKVLLNTLVAVIFFILWFGLLLHVIGHDFLVNIGYRDDWSTFYVNQAPAFCQREAGTEYCRTQSLFTGPNRYSAYLLTIIPFVWFYIKNKNLKYFLTSAALLSLAMTLSMSSWIAFIAAFCVTFAAVQKKLVKKHYKKIFSASALLLIFTFIAFLIFKDTIILKASDSHHIKLPLEALKIFSENPLGYGLAHIGPGSFKLSKELLAENWLIQIAVNTGIFGLLAFLAIWFHIFKNLLQKNTIFSLIAIFAITALLTQNLFLDPLVEIGRDATLMLLIAIALYSKPAQESV